MQRRKVKMQNIARIVFVHFQSAILVYAVFVDHLEPEKKRESICKMAINYSNAQFYKFIDDEISKTRLLCTNCHKKHTKEQARKISLLNVLG
jgi:hypothetical protein